jgi:hypothetical protein
MHRERSPAGFSDLDASGGIIITHSFEKSIVAICLSCGDGESRDIGSLVNWRLVNWSLINGRLVNGNIRDGGRSVIDNGAGFNNRLRRHNDGRSRRFPVNDPDSLNRAAVLHFHH